MGQANYWALAAQAFVLLLARQTVTCQTIVYIPRG